MGCPCAESRQKSVHKCADAQRGGYPQEDQCAALHRWIKAREENDGQQDECPSQGHPGVLAYKRRESLPICISPYDESRAIESQGEYALIQPERQPGDALGPVRGGGFAIDLAEDIASGKADENEPQQGLRRDALQEGTYKGEDKERPQIPQRYIAEIPVAP